MLWPFLFACKTSDEVRAVGCGPSGLHQLDGCGLGFSFFDSDGLFGRVCLGKGLDRVCARKMACRLSRFHSLTPQLE
jgi:hypothetical protein